MFSKPYSRAAACSENYSTTFTMEGWYDDNMQQQHKLRLWKDKNIALA